MTRPAAMAGAATGTDQSATEDQTAKRRRPRGLGWIAVAVDYSRHPKAILLADHLGDPRAPLHLPAVWCWFAEHFADGVMPERPAFVTALEGAALWQGKPGELVAAMVEVGLLERERGRLAVHDWEIWQSGHIDALARDRERKRRMRAELRKKSPLEVPETVPKTSELASPSPSSVTSPSESRSLASDGTSTETSPSSAAGLLAAAPNGKGPALDAEAQAIRALLPAKALDLSKALDVPAGAIDDALEDLRRRGRVRLRGGLVPLWEWIA